MCQRIATGSIQLDGSSKCIDTGMENCQKTGTFINSSNMNLQITAGVQYVVPARMCLTIPIIGPITIGPHVAADANRNDPFFSGQLIWQVTDDFSPPSLTSIYTETYKEEATNLANGLGQTYTEIQLGKGNYKKLVFILNSSAVSE